MGSSSVEQKWARVRRCKWQKRAQYRQRIAVTAIATAALQLCETPQIGKRLFLFTWNLTAYGTFPLAPGIARSVWIFPFPRPIQPQKCLCWKDPKPHPLPPPCCRQGHAPAMGIPLGQEKWDAQMLYVSFWTDLRGSYGHSNHQLLKIIEEHNFL